MDCPNRAHHYDAYARWQKAARADQPVALNSLSPAAEQSFIAREIGQITSHCQAPLDLECLSKRKRSCNLSDIELKTIHDLGFRHFKLQGRADNPLFFAFDLVRFMLEPHVAAPLAYKTMLHIICSAGSGQEGGTIGLMAHQPAAGPCAAAL